MVVLKATKQLDTESQCILSLVDEKQGGEGSGIASLSVKEDDTFDDSDLMGGEETKSAGIYSSAMSMCRPGSAQEFQTNTIPVDRFHIVELQLEHKAKQGFTADGVETKLFHQKDLLALRLGCNSSPEIDIAEASYSKLTIFASLTPTLDSNSIFRS